MSQLHSEAEEKHGKEFLLPPPVVLFWPPTRGGQSVFQSPLTQMIIWSCFPESTDSNDNLVPNTLADTPRNRV